MARIPASDKLSDIQGAFRTIWETLDLLTKDEVNFSKRQKITNAINGTHPQDYVTLSQMAQAIAGFLAGGGGKTGLCLTGAVTYDPASLGDGAGVTTTITVAGAGLGNFALASFSLDLQSVMLFAWVSAANTVSVRFQNESGGTVDLSSGTIRVLVFPNVLSLR